MASKARNLVVQITSFSINQCFSPLPMSYQILNAGKYCIWFDACVVCDSHFRVPLIHSGTKMVLHNLLLPIIVHKPFKCAILIIASLISINRLQKHVLVLANQYGTIGNRHMQNTQFPNTHFQLSSSFSRFSGGTSG